MANRRPEPTASSRFFLYIVSSPVQLSARLPGALRGTIQMSDMSDPSGHDRGAWKNPAAFAKQKATNIAEQQKSKVADRFAGAAGAVGDAAKNLQREMPQAAEYIEDVSDRLSSAAAALRERSIDNLIQTASTFARQQPAVFFAGAVFAGFALSRFLKSSNLEAQR